MGEEGGTTTGQEGGGGINPAWNDLLGEIPQDLHEKVTPHLQKWDENFTKQVNSAKEPFAPYQEFIDGEVDPEHLRMGIGFLSALQNNPREVFDLLAQQYNFSLEDGQGGKAPQNSGQTQGLTDEDLEGLPQVFVDKIRKMEKALDLMAQEHLRTQEEKTKAAADKKMADEIASLKNKHGEFDEKFVLAHMLMDMKPEDAIQSYNSLVENIIKQHEEKQRAPKILGGGSLVPGEGKLDMSKIVRDPKSRKEYIMQRLQQAAFEKQGS